MQVTALKPFGVQVTNVDVTCPHQMNRIQNLLWSNGIVILPAGSASKGSQPVHHDKSIFALGKLFGQPDPYHPVNPNKSGTEVQVLQTRGHSGIPADSFIWHSDITWRVNPPRASVLCAYQLPPSGGDTCFQNTNIMYNRLSPHLKTRIENLTFNHSLKVGYDRVNRNGDVQTDHTASHPGVIAHPETGAPLLFVNENFTVDCQGMDKAESDALLKEIFAQAYSKEHTVTHKWNLYDVVIWDNLGTQHLAKDDYEDLRVMHRVVASDPKLRLERYISKEVSVQESVDVLKLLLNRKDNSTGYTEHATVYDMHMRKANYIVPQVATDLLSKHLKTSWSSAGSEPLLLDLAAGTGQNAIHLTHDHQLKNIEAMDLTEAMLSEARRRELYKRYYIANANEYLPLESNKYDAALCVGGLAKNQIKASPAIGNLVRVTKPGGFVVITVQSRDEDYIEAVRNLISKGQAAVAEIKNFVGIRTMPSVEHSAYVLRVICGA